MPLHRNLTEEKVHSPFFRVYADSTARLAATGFSADDVNKVALQLSDGSMWRLTDDSPVTWQAIGSGDMTKAVYDTDDDGVVDAAETASIADDIDIGGLTAGTPVSGDYVVYEHAGVRKKADVDDLPGGGGGGGGFTPSHFSIPLIWPNSNTNFGTVGTDQKFYYLVSNGTQNALAKWNINLPAGTYSWLLGHISDSNRGKYHLLLDGVDVGNIDGYGSAGVFHTDTLTGITCAGGAPVEVQIKMASKNASASNYYGTPMIMWLIRTGA